MCSITTIAGVLGAVLLIKGLFFRRRFHAHGGHACSGGGRGWRRGYGSGPGGSFWLRRLFGRLDTTPGQEREIRSAIEDLQGRARDAKDALKSARGDLAKAIRGAEIDDAAIGEATARADLATGQIKDAFAATLRRVHAVLDDKQRERLADLLANGPGWGRWGGGRWGGPYRESI